MHQPHNHPVSPNESAQSSEPQLPPSARVVSMINAMATFHTIRVAARYNLAGIIEAHGPLTVAVLAKQTGTHAFSLSVRGILLSG